MVSRRDVRSTERLAGVLALPVSQVPACEHMWFGLLPHVVSADISKAGVGLPVNRQHSCVLVAFKL